MTSDFFSIFLTDLRMPYLDGMQLIREIHKQHIPVTVIVMTGHASVDAAVEAMQAGAYDFFTKPLNLERLKLVIARILQERNLRDELVYLREQMNLREAFAHVISKSPRMHAILELVGHIATTTTTVLINEGETGTGKEMIAAPFIAPRQVPSARPAGKPVNSGYSAGEPVGKRVVRSRKGVVHRLGGAAEGAVRAGQSGHAVPRRGERDSACGCRSSCCERCRIGDSSGSAGRSRSRWTCV